MESPLFPGTAFPLNRLKQTAMIALITIESNLEALCRRCQTDLQLQSIEAFSSFGSDGIAIHVNDLPMVYSIVEWFIQHGCESVYMQDGTHVHFTVEDVGCIDLRLHQQHLLKIVKDLDQAIMNIDLPIDRPDFWIIDDGKQFALDRSNAQTHQPSNQNTRPNIEQQVKVDQDANECVICLSRKPDTTVLPCLHTVVCYQCSKQLENDPVNKTICVVCRQPIDAILT